MTATAEIVTTHINDAVLVPNAALRFTPETPDASKQGEVISIDAGLDPAAIRARLLKRVTENEGGVRLEDASIIVSGGRGIGSAEGFEQLQELAALLKGAVGASRPACATTACSACA